MDFPTKKYKVIIVDPPWDINLTLGKFAPYKYKTKDSIKTTSHGYSSMSIVDIKNISIKSIADETCFLWLWCTTTKQKNKIPTIVSAFEILEHWGFAYHTLITWDKGYGVCPFSPYQFVTEHVVFGYKGKFTEARKHCGKLKTCFRAKPVGHSIKPAIFYEDIAKSFDGPRIDLFARQIRPGYDGWGDEYGKEMGINEARSISSRLAWAKRKEEKEHII